LALHTLIADWATDRHAGGDRLLKEAVTKAVVSKLQKVKLLNQ
jgi:hypothetical protein